MNYDMKVSKKIIETCFLFKKKLLHSEVLVLDQYIQWDIQHVVLKV